MTPTIKKVIRLSSYALLITIGAFLALFPFLKKNEEYTTTYKPGVPDAQADVTSAPVPYYDPVVNGDGGGSDDDGSI